MNITSENIMMTIPFELAPPPLIRVISADIDFTVFPYTRENEDSEQFPVSVPQLVTQVSAEIDWESWPYCLSFPTSSKL